MTQRQATDLAREMAKGIMDTIIKECEAACDGVSPENKALLMTGDVDRLKRAVCVQLANFMNA
jgi:hypothetical protein